MVSVFNILFDDLPMFRFPLVFFDDSYGRSGSTCTIIVLEVQAVPSDPVASDQSWARRVSQRAPLRQRGPLSGTTC